MASADSELRAFVNPNDVGETTVTVGSDSLVVGTRIESAVVASATTLTLVVDGVETATEMVASLASSPSGRLVIGGDEGFVRQGCDGFLDEVRLRNVAVTPAAANLELAAMLSTASTVVVEIAP